MLLLVVLVLTNLDLVVLSNVTFQRSFWRDLLIFLVFAEKTFCFSSCIVKPLDSQLHNFCKFCNILKEYSYPAPAHCKTSFHRERIKKKQNSSTLPWLSGWEKTLQFSKDLTPCCRAIQFAKIFMQFFSILNLIFLKFTFDLGYWSSGTIK